MPEHAATEPVMDPALSLGWRSGPLDGLSCLLRCVEVVLRSRGFTNTEIARALARPVDLVAARGSGSHFRYGNLAWRNTTDGRDHFAELIALVDGGEPCILMPDRYYWPGDEFEGRHHFLDHMVLAVGHGDGELQVLDIDAPPEDGYRRRLKITPELERSACRFAVVEMGLPEDDTPVAQVDSLLRPTASRLTEDLPALQGFADRWQVEGLTGPGARSLHVVVLGELQPMLFLSSVAVEEAHPAAAALLATAARRAHVLGKALLGAHRFAGTDPDDTSVYRPILPIFESTRGALRTLAAELSGHLGEQFPVPQTAADDRLWQRMLRGRHWSYGEVVAPPDAQPATRKANPSAFCG